MDSLQAKGRLRDLYKLFYGFSNSPFIFAHLISTVLISYELEITVLLEKMLLQVKKK